MWKRTKLMLREMAEESTVHGVKYLRKDQSLVSRVYWGVAVTCALCGSGWLSWQLWARFMELPIRSVVKDSQEAAARTPLPALTLCSEPAQPFITNFIDNVFVFTLMLIPRAYSRELVEQATIDTSLYIHDSSHKILNFTLLQVLDHVLDLNRIPFREYVSLLVAPCDRLLKRCWLRGDPVPCQQLFRRTHGRCCSFNVKHPGEAFVPEFPSESVGISEGLSLVISGEFGESRFMIHQTNNYPVLDRGSYAIRRGKQIYLGLQAFEIDCFDEVRQLNEKVRGCVFEDERSLRFFSKYSYQNCPVECRMNASLALCECIDYIYPILDNLVCNATKLQCLQQYSFLGKNYGIRSNDDNIKMVEEALEDKPLSVDFECPVNCDYWDYRVIDVHVSSLDAITDDITGFYSRDVVDAAQDGVVHVFYPSRRYMLQETLLIADSVTLLSNLGGVFGLFLGCSFLTLAELVYSMWRHLVAATFLPYFRSRFIALCRPRRKLTSQRFRKVQMTLVGPALYAATPASVPSALYIQQELLDQLSAHSSFYVHT